MTPNRARSSRADPLPITIRVGMSILAIWNGFVVSYNGLLFVAHAAIGEGGVDRALESYLSIVVFVVSGAVGVLTLLGVRRLVRGRPQRASMIAFVILSGVAFVTLIAPFSYPIPVGLGPSGP